MVCQYASPVSLAFGNMFLLLNAYSLQFTENHRVIETVLVNRKKKIQGIFNKKLKKAKARLNPKNKPKYVSKAERAKLENSNDEHATLNSDAASESS